MRLLLQCFLIVAFLGSGAFARCAGSDQRPGLTAAQSAELSTRLAQQPFRTGNHWVAQKGQRQLHIVGTLHIDDPRHSAIVNRLAPVLQIADVLLVEATEAEEAALQNAAATRPEMLFIQDGPSLLERMSEPEWAALAAAAEARGIPAFMAAKFQPWYLSLILGMPPCVIQSMSEGQRGLDHRLQDIAKAAGVPIGALEPWDTLFSIFGAKATDEQIDMLKLSVFPTEVAEDAIATLVAQYFEEDHGAVMDTSRIITRDQVDMPPEAFDAAFDALLAGILIARNLAWMDVIAAQKGDRIVIAVGAGHLAGKQGLLQLLAEDGYTLSRAQF